MSSLDDHYRLLDASPTATLKEIRVIYRDLAQVWHPDRFQGNPRLREKAEAKLKVINLAYEAIRDSLESGATPTPTPTPTPTAAPSGPRPQPAHAQSAKRNPGHTIPEHEADALGWYAKAAADGHADSQCIIATMYAEGQLVPRDEDKATHWFKLSAAQGHPAAEFQMGLRYYSGGGVPKDPQKAFKFYRRAALQGHTKAQYSLGLMYTNGMYVLRDDASAFAWLSLSSEGGHPGSLTLLESIEGNLNTEEKSRAIGQIAKLKKQIAAGI